MDEKWIYGLALVVYFSVLTLIGWIIWNEDRSLAEFDYCKRVNTEADRLETMASVLMTYYLDIFIDNGNKKTSEFYQHVKVELIRRGYDV